MARYASKATSMAALRRMGGRGRGGPVGLSRKGQMLQLQMEGVEGLEKALRELAAFAGSRTMQAAMKRALVKAAQPAVEDAQRRAPRQRGSSKPHMADKIAVSTTLSRKQRRLQGFGARHHGTAVVYMGAGPRGPAVLAEFGTGPRRHKSGKSTGSMPATPFMRPAWEAHKYQILRDFSKLLWVEIEKAAKRAARRHARGTAGKKRR